MTAPLHGLKIIDLTTVLMGPYATQILGDYGADVIKVEAPGGDILRKLGPGRRPDMGHVYLNTNRSKRSIVLDLKLERGRQALLRLCDDADVLVYSIRPQAMERLGLGWDVIAQRNPRIVGACLTGYGQGGRYAGRAAYDDLIQSGAMIPYLFERLGYEEPTYVPLALADRVVGLTAVGAILAGVHARDRAGVGQHIEVPMFETMLSFVLGDHLGGRTFRPNLDDGGGARLLTRGRKPYRTADGYIAVLLYTDAHWTRFTNEVGIPELMQDPRFASYAARVEHIDHVYGWVEAIMPKRTTDSWLELLERIDVPFMRMHDFESIHDDPHLRDVGFFREVQHPTEGPVVAMRNPVCFEGTPVETDRLAPALGANTREVLGEARFTPAEIDDLLRGGVAHASDAG